MNQDRAAPQTVSLSRQVLIPLLGACIVSAVTLALLSQWWAADQASRQSAARLQTIGSVLANTNFPISTKVLEDLQRLSDLQFIVGNADGSLRSSTLPVSAEDAARILSDAFPAQREPRRSSERLIRIDGRDYRITSVRRAADNDSLLVLLEPQSGRDQISRQLALMPLITGLTTLVLVAAVAWLTMQRVIRRIGMLESQVQGIAEGRLDTIHLTGPRDQLSALAGSVNGMAHELRSMWQRIRETERAGLLSQVAGGLAHQLRNAVTGIHLAVQLHRRTCPMGNQENLAVAERELSRTSQYIKQLLQLAVGKEQPAEPGELQDILHDSEQLLSAIAAHRKIPFHWSADESITGVTVRDRELMRSAIVNLALNALDAAGIAGEVSVMAERSVNEIRIKVSDTGAGPPESLKNNLFDPFVSSKPEGLGVGLTVVRSAAEANRGRIDWRRENDHTLFEFVLPIAGATSTTEQRTRTE
ncbi:MAG: HAMP domain-containing sensor histidine kinase [Pirellulales bacterium]